MKYIYFIILFFISLFLSSQNSQAVQRVDEFKIIHGTQTGDPIKCLLVSTYYDLNGEEVGVTRFNSPHCTVCNQDSVIYKDFIFHKDSSTTIYVNVYNNEHLIDSCITTSSVIFSDSSKRFIRVVKTCNEDTSSYFREVLFDKNGHKTFEKIENAIKTKKDNRTWKYNRRGDLTVYSRSTEWGYFEEKRRYDRKGRLKLEKDNGDIFFGPSVKRIKYKRDGRKEVHKYSRIGNHRNIQIRDVAIYKDDLLSFDKHIVFGKKGRQKIPRKVIKTKYFYQMKGSESITKSEKMINGNISITEIRKNSNNQITELKKDGRILKVYDYIDLVD